jgi:hypothetical protein
MCARRISHGDRSEVEIGIEDAARLHLVPVVILGVDPENGDGDDAMLLFDAFSETDRRHRLQQREERSPKESGLLTRQDGDRSIVSKLTCCGDRFGRRASSALLRQQEVGNCLPLSRISLCSHDGVAPGRGVGRVAGIELSHAREVERVIGGQPSDPRKAADVDGKPRGWDRQT